MCVKIGCLRSKGGKKTERATNSRCINITLFHKPPWPLWIIPKFDLSMPKAGVNNHNTIDECLTLTNHTFSHYTAGHKVTAKVSLPWWTSSSLHPPFSSTYEGMRSYLPYSRPAGTSSSGVQIDGEDSFQLLLGTSCCPKWLHPGISRKVLLTHQNEIDIGSYSSQEPLQVMISNVDLECR